MSSLEHDFAVKYADHQVTFRGIHTGIEFAGRVAGVLPRGATASWLSGDAVVVAKPPGAGVNAALYCPNVIWTSTNIPEHIVTFDLTRYVMLMVASPAKADFVPMTFAISPDLSRYPKTCPKCTQPAYESPVSGWDCSSASCHLYRA